MFCKNQMLDPRKVSLLYYMYDSSSFDGKRKHLWIIKRKDFPSNHTTLFTWSLSPLLIRAYLCQVLDRCVLALFWSVPAQKHLWHFDHGSSQRKMNLTRNNSKMAAVIKFALVANLFAFAQGQTRTRDEMSIMEIINATEALSEVNLGVQMLEKCRFSTAHLNTTIREHF